MNVPQNLTNIEPAGASKFTTGTTHKLCFFFLPRLWVSICSAAAYCGSFLNTYSKLYMYIHKEGTKYRFHQLPVYLSVTTSGTMGHQ